MKTLEETKKGLECCSLPGCKGEECPYDHDDPCHFIMHEDALAYIKQLEEREWELLNLLSRAWYGKQYYFKQEDGTVYSRKSCQYLTFDESIDEFAQSLTVEPKEE